MKTARTILKWIGVAIGCLVVGIQFVGPVRSNPPVYHAQAPNTRLQMTPEVTAVLNRACNDCHSNNTRWPWYSHVAPVSWFVIDHVNQGRRHLNFSDWGSYSPQEARGLLNGICKESSTGAMPLSSYTSIHRDAKLSPQDVKLLCEIEIEEPSR